MRRTHRRAFHSLKLLALVSIVIAAILVAMLAWSPGSRQVESSSEPLFMYCAAGIRLPVDLIADEYARQSYGCQVQLQYNGSNTLLSQLEVAGVGDLYLAADESYIELATNRGLVQEAIPVARLRPVVVVPKGNPKNIHSSDDLIREDVRIALGEPGAAAIGKKTRRLMETAGRWKALSNHAIVFTPTVNAIADAVRVGSVDAGIVWDAIVAQYADLEAVRLPELDEGEARIMIGVLASSKQPTAALQFARYLTSRDQGLEVFREHGYIAVEGDEWDIEPRLTVYSGGVNRIAIEDTLDRFKRREGVQIDVIYNGCGILCTQMKALRRGDHKGAFPDAYFSCDVSFMEQVSDLFLDPVNISETDMVIITTPGNTHEIHRLEDLAAAEIKLGVANPDESALGALTRRLLRELDIEESIQKNVRTQTPTADLLVNQVKLRALDAAIVYRANTSQVIGDVEVIDIDHPLALAVQPYAAARDTNHRNTVERLLAAIRRSRPNFEAAGFRYLPAAPTP